MPKPNKYGVGRTGVALRALANSKGNSKAQYARACQTVGSTRKECTPGRIEQSHSQSAGSENWIRDQGQPMRGDSELRGTTREWSYNDDGEKESCLVSGLAQEQWEEDTSWSLRRD